jgi:hypothetical protein
MGVRGQRHALAALYPREMDPRYSLDGDWMGPRGDLDTEARGKNLSPLPGIELRSPGQPVRSQTPYLNYPAHTYSRYNALFLPKVQ